MTWSNTGENLSNNGEKLMIFTTGNIKGSDYCYIGDLGIMYGLKETHLTGCIAEIIGFHMRLKGEEILYIHEYFMRKWGITDTIASY